MVDRKQLETMIGKARAAGATVDVHIDREGYIVEIKVAGLTGCGPFPLSPIAFSEAMHALGLGV
jgi:hypothetical protein